MTEPYKSGPTPLIPEGLQDTTVVSDKNRVHALASLLLGVNSNNLLEAVKVLGGSVATTVLPGEPKYTLFYPVLSSDITGFPSKYNAGSLNSPKTIITFPQSAEVGDPAWQTSFEYHFASAPKFVSHITEGAVELTLAMYNQFNTP